MGEVQELQLQQIKVQPEADKEATSDPQTTENGELIDNLQQNKWHGWFLVTLNIIFVIVGQSAATLLGRFYFDRGGNSKWMATLVQVAGWPILAIILPFFPSFTPTKIGAAAANPTPTTSGAAISATKLFSIYFCIGLLAAGDNMMYSWGLAYLPVSTYSLICSTQLAFNAVFSFFLNKQKLTPFILNSLVLVTFSATLLAVDSHSDRSTGISTAHYAIGFVCTLCASALYSLIVSLTQFFFQNVIKRDDFSVVLELQIYASVVATIAIVLGLFVSGDWENLKREMVGFESGKVSYLNTLVWTAVGWQVASVGVLGLIFTVSSLFSNVISTLALPVVPILAVVFFHDKMDGIKVMAMLIGLWGFVSYFYQNYLDSSPRTRTNKLSLPLVSKEEEFWDITQHMERPDQCHAAVRTIASVAKHYHEDFPERSPIPALLSPNHALTVEIF